MGAETVLSTLVVLLIVIVAALAGVRFKYNNSVYGAEASAHAATYKVFQEQVESLHRQISSGADKVAQVQEMLTGLNTYVQELRRENERMHSIASRLRNQIRSLGEEPVE